MKENVYIALIFFLSLGLLSFNILIQEEWLVPTNYQEMYNPEEASKGNIAIGKSVYSQHCKSCHGKKGYGDGANSTSLNTNISNFSTDEFQSQSDGTLFYKIFIGRNEMPSHKKKLSKEDIWLTIHFMRTFVE